MMPLDNTKGLKDVSVMVLFSGRISSSAEGESLMTENTGMPYMLNKPI